jgi:hypothetical protein
MEDQGGRRIVLKYHNWELPALISLVAAVAASLYAVTPSFISIATQIRAAKATIVSFSKDDWKLVGEDLVLEIESDFMLFRVETRKDATTFQEVMGGTETTEDGKVTRVCFSNGVADEHLAGRIVVR